MNRIFTLSRGLSLMFKILFVATGLGTLLIWWFSPDSFQWLRQFGISMPALFVPIMSATLTHGQKLLAFSISLIPASITMLTFYRAIQLFDLYQHKVIFSSQNVMLLRKISSLLLIRQCIEPFYQALLSPVLTWHNPPGQTILAISFNDVNLGLLMLSFCILLVSLIMQEGLKIKEDNAAFI